MMRRARQATSLFYLLEIFHIGRDDGRAKERHRFNDRLIGISLIVGEEQLE
jgi:hypothetical protein